MALRTYRRKVQRLAESQTVVGRSTLGGRSSDYVGVLEDLVESGLVYRAGRGSHASYRAASPADLDYMKGDGVESDGADTLVWGSVYRLGPITRDALATHVTLPARELDASLQRLVETGRVTRTEADGVVTLRADGFVVPIGASCSAGKPRCSITSRQW